MAGRRLTSTPDELYHDALSRGGEASKSGRYLITFKKDATIAGAQMLNNTYGLAVASAADFQSHGVALEGLSAANALLLPEIGVAIVEGEAFEEHRVSSAGLYAQDSPIASIDDEYFAFGHARHADYLRGFGHAASAIAADLADEEDTSESFTDSGQITWGMAACGVANSQFTGQGIRIAMLDSGLDFGHPDFLGRIAQSNSFVGQPPQDGAGHGTHTAGTACGPSNSGVGLPRYGIASSATILIGKVLNNSLLAVGGSILIGMNWAIANGCDVISISASGPPQVQPAFTQAGAAALTRGLLMIAAAGNQSQRPMRIAATGYPANSPTIMSVAALDQNLNIAPFSNAGKVDIAGPGVNVLSSYPRPTLGKILSGTSQATPHVAGVAALYAEANPQLRGTALWTQLRSSARQLPLSSSDIGAGLVQAPI